MSAPDDSDTPSTTEAAALSESGALFEQTVRLPDIGSIAASLDAELPAVPARGPTTPWWPFFAYLGVWVGCAAAAGWLFANSGRETAVIASERYAYSVIGGVGLTLIGPALALVVWLATYARSNPGGRTGLLGVALVRGAAVTLAGVALWWAMLVVVDAVRLGRPW